MLIINEMRGGDLLDVDKHIEVGAQADNVVELALIGIIIAGSGQAEFVRPFQPATAGAWGRSAKVDDVERDASVPQDVVVAILAGRRHSEGLQASNRVAELLAVSVEHSLVKAGANHQVLLMVALAQEFPHDGVASFVGPDADMPIVRPEGNLFPAIAVFV